ncbi:MAG: hypothetical protein JSS96_09385 [Bacteroidetes bacterium]|nr:hypothetical protein [Bacteroidota bacterium]
MQRLEFGIKNVALEIFQLFLKSYIMKKLLIPSLFLSLLTLVSCWRTMQCVNPMQQLQFIGFDSTELNSVILYKYQTGNTFSNLVDSFDIGTNSYRWDHYYGGYYPDSLIIMSSMVHKPYDTLLTINNFYDWEVYIPATGKRYFISDVKYDQQTKKMRIGWEPIGQSCFNNTSYYLNDTLFALNKDSLDNKFDRYGSEDRNYISIKLYK